jgi:6-phosphofructokinase 1
MKKIAILTRDCAGINAAIRSAVRTALTHNLEIVGILRGYEGLINGEIMPLNHRSVSGIINRGGTILKTSRSKNFYLNSGQEKAVKSIKENNIDGLIVIGGNGSLTAAHILATNYQIPIIGVPATIDNDISGVDLSIGADTAVNVALDALDKIRDTATSLERIFIVEVMGRSCGYIALNVALAGGCEEVIVPEKELDLDIMCNEIIEGNEKGKMSWIIIVAEGKAKAQDIAEIITKKTKLETRIAVLGHIQRGGRPTATDRRLGTILGNYAVEVLINGTTDHCVTIKNDKFISFPLSDAIKTKKIDVDTSYKLIKVLT